MLPFADYCKRVERHLEDVYGIHVITRDVPDPLLGDLDGAEIHIDHSVTPEQRLFLLGHLFGHTVQWNVDPEAYELGRPRKPPVADQFIPVLMNYERPAAAYALGMFHQIGITDADQWLSNYTAADMNYLSHYYRTGEKRDFKSFWQERAPLIPPQPVPLFTLTKRSFRTDGIVI